jgi:hypothetical protein
MTEEPGRWDEKYASPIEVIMNTTATAVVIFVKNPPGPAEPKTVWLDPPPKAAPISAPFPVWRRTMTIKSTQTRI